MSLSERIRKCAEIAGSGDDLARKSETPRSTLETYLTGKAEPKAGRIAAFCYATGVNGHWLLTGEGSMLISDVQQASSPHMAVDVDNLGHALAEVETIATQRGLTLTPNKRAKLAALVYQYFLLDKAENETTAYLSQLIELVSN